jgi:hypothetical protein
MIIVRLIGGMGNQMFQYALGRALSLENSTELFLDIQRLIDHKKSLVNKKFVYRNFDLDMFFINAKIAKRKDIPLTRRVFGNATMKDVLYILSQKIFKNRYKEKHFHFDPEILNAKGDVYLDGYWQSYKYFDKYADVIRKDFQVIVPLSEEIKNLGKEISSTKSLCVHIRRGDFVGNAFHNVLTENYHEDAFKIISENNIIEKIYVFSDDIEWCKENIQFPIETMYVDRLFAGERGVGHFWLMTQCNHFIIPNSTFSWWAAWLSERAGKQVVAPKKWLANDYFNYKDMYPSDWVSI